LSPARLREAVAELCWYQTIDLGHGVVTPGVSDSAKILERLALPESLAGRTVIDIGAADGFFAFECERRGASRVVATDSIHWSEGHWTGKAPFSLARRALGSAVEDYTIDLMDLTHEAVSGPFDVALLLGVLYHLRHPMLGLERVAAMTRDLLILETQADFLNVARPAIAFYADSELNGDPSNWHGPNVAALRGMLRAVGFRIVKVVYCPPFHTRLAAAIVRRWRQRLGAQSSGASECGALWPALAQGRAVVHARKGSPR
jgi:tRNA (mo5U34)-methyltransferase